MKTHVLSLFLVNILSIFSMVHALSDDCIRLNSFLGRDQSTDCCKNNAECDADGNFIKLILSDADNTNKPNYMRFPVFEKLVKLSVGIKDINDNILPSRFFEQPMLDTLNVYESNLSSIQNNFNKNSPITEINLEHNELTEFPYQLSALPKLQHLYLWDNKISGTVDLENFKTLNQIDVGKNQIVDMINIPSGINVLFMFENPISKIPDEVPSLVDLNYLDFNSTKITEIPPDLFKLRLLFKNLSINSFTASFLLIPNL